MKNIDFNTVISEIPQTAWEVNLPIGEYRHCHIDKVMIRPFSVVGRCEIAGSDGSATVYIKKYRKQDGRTEERHLEKIRRDIEASAFWYDQFKESEHFKVVKPVLAIPEKAITVTEESPGRSLYHLLLANAHILSGRSQFDNTIEQLRKVGEWLKFKQQQMRCPGEVYALSELHEYFNIRMDILSSDKRRRFPADLPSLIQDYWQAQSGCVPPEERSVTINHSDFNPGNILINGNTVTVLDFGRLVRGPYLLDISKLYFQLQLLTFKPQFSTAAIRKLQQALFEGYGNTAAPQTQMFKLLMVRHLLTHLSNITRFWKFPLGERIYNTWVMRNEIGMLRNILSESNGCGGDPSG